MIEDLAADPRRRAGRRPTDGRRPGKALWLVGAVVVGLVLYLVRGLLLPFLLAVVLAYLLHPLVSRVEALGIRRMVAVIGVFVFILVVLVGAGLVLGPRVRSEAESLAANLPSLTVKVEKAIDAEVKATAATHPGLRRFLPVARRGGGWLERLIEERAGTVEELLGNASRIAGVVILAPLFAFFLLGDGGRLVTYVIDRLHPAHIETTVAIWYAIDRIIGRYFVRLTLEGIGVGIPAAAGLWAIGVPYPLLLGAFTALINPLPFVGTLCSVTAAAVVSLAQGQGLHSLAAIVALYLAIRLVDDILIVPVFVGRSLHLHPLLVIVSIVAGEQALGLLGMVIAVLTVTLIKEISQLLLEHRRQLQFGPLPVPTRPLPIPTYVC